MDLEKEIIDDDEDDYTTEDLLFRMFTIKHGSKFTGEYIVHGVIEIRRNG